MEDLKLLVEMVSHLPTMALWVIAGFYAYKVVVIGSIYGVIRFVAGRLFDWLEKKKTMPMEMRPVIDGICISGQADHLIAQLHRIRHHSMYIHSTDVQWLQQAIDEKMESEKAKKS